MSMRKISKNKHSHDLDQTLSYKYQSRRLKESNPGLEYKRVYSGIHNVSQDGVIIENGRRNLYVRTYDDHRDKRVKKTRIHRTHKGKYILNVRNIDTRDYNLLTRLIDKALKIK